jgi:peroxiredoxin
MALNIGDAAPDFELPDHTGKRVRLRDFRGKNSVVLAFYVYASTPG